MKVVPDACAADPERLARFEREAQILASLNHPNIAIIHGLEEADGVKALGVLTPSGSMELMLWRSLVLESRVLIRGSQ